MSNKKQISQQLSTEEKLEFFIERAEALSRYFSENFANFNIAKIGVSRVFATQSEGHWPSKR